MKVCWIVGEPGAGKTTTVRELLGKDMRLIAKPKWTLAEQRRIAAAGHYNGGKFDGADTVPYNGVTEALSFWAEYVCPRADVTLFDGDRFSNAGVVDFFKARPEVELSAIYVYGPQTAAERRVARGTTQNPTWVKGRATKAARFAQMVPSLQISAEDPPDVRAAHVRKHLNLQDL